jgi:LAGLIDADG DNA endonuclease family
LFYNNGIKGIKPELAMYLTPISLAYFIGGDGTRSGSGLALCTNSFTQADCDLLASMLYKQLGLVCTVHSAGADSGDQFRVYVNAVSMPLLRQMVMPHLHPSMHYKLGIGKR